MKITRRGLAEYARYYRIDCSRCRTEFECYIAEAFRGGECDGPIIDVKCPGCGHWVRKDATLYLPAGPEVAEVSDFGLGTYTGCLTAIWILLVFLVGLAIGYGLGKP